MTLSMKVQRDVLLYTTLSSPRPNFTPLLHLIQAKREREWEKKSEIRVIHFASHLSLSLSLSLSLKAGRVSRVLGVKNSIS